MLGGQFCPSYIPGIVGGGRFMAGIWPQVGSKRE